MKIKDTIMKLFVNLVYFGTCGYIGDNFWNIGRTAEIKDRYLHVDNKELNFEE